MQARHAAARHGDATENEQRVTALDGDKPTAPRIHINKSSHSTFEAVLLIDTLPTLLASSRVETAVRHCCAIDVKRDLRFLLFFTLQLPLVCAVVPYHSE